MKTSRSASLIFLAVVVHLTAMADSSIDEQLVAFVNPPERLSRGFIAGLPDLKRQRPDLAPIIPALAKHFDAAELDRRLAVVVRDKMTASEKNVVLAFIESPAGKEAGRLQREYDDPKAQAAAANRLPASTLSQISTFMESTTGRKLLGILNSPEVATIEQAYTTELACDQIRISYPGQIAVFEAQGACRKQ